MERLLLNALADMRLRRRLPAPPAKVFRIALGEADPTFAPFHAVRVLIENSR